MGRTIKVTIWMGLELDLGQYDGLTFLLRGYNDILQNQLTQHGPSTNATSSHPPGNIPVLSTSTTFKPDTTYSLLNQNPNNNY